LVFVALVVTAAALPHHIPLRYWLHTAAIALLVMLVYDLASRLSGGAPELVPGLFKERVIDVLIGCALALVGTELGFYWGSHAKPAVAKAAPNQPN
jgi:phosphate starvation-inducible membrane PsiE